ncbi:protein N-terminal glutamine amidohydrolase [Neosynchiropus ocellatus]
MNFEDRRITPKREDCVYTSCYCEENVWKLCEFVRTEGTTPMDQVFAVFISNDKKVVPLWKQKTGCGDEPVFWDYHVVLLHAGTQCEPLIYDLDTAMPFPCTLEQYATEALRSDHEIKPQFHRKLRVVPCACFLKNFASDRSHMKDAFGQWKMPPPHYPAISNTACQMNLNEFVSMDARVGWGRVFTLENFLRSFIAELPTENTSVAVFT